MFARQIPSDGAATSTRPRPRTLRECGYYSCQCVKEPKQPCPVCGQVPCACPKDLCSICEQIPCECKKKPKTKVQLANGKELAIQHMMCTTFWHPDGTPMSAQQFLELLFGKLPEFFKDEAELLKLWSNPVTRKMLLMGARREGIWPRAAWRDAEDH